MTGLKCAICRKADEPLTKYFPVCSKCGFKLVEKAGHKLYSFIFR